MRTKWVPS